MDLNQLAEKIDQLEERIEQTEELKEKVEALQSTISELLDEVDNYRRVLKAITLVALVEDERTTEADQKNNINIVKAFLEGSGVQH